jgi:cytochrome c peroxidase
MAMTLGVIALTYTQCRKADVAPSEISRAVNPAASPLDGSNLQAKQDLGKKIFFDKRLSTPTGQACASCHAPSAAFSDPSHLSTSAGAVSGLFGGRNAPVVTYAQYAPPFHYDEVNGTYIGGIFWDGRVNTLAEQAQKPFFNPIEMNLSGPASLASKIASADYYGDFKQVYGASKDANTILSNVGDAIAAYEQSDIFHPFNSKFDDVMKGKDRFTADENTGWVLYTGKAKCANCHVSDPDPLSGKILFTDYTYDNIGVPRNPSNRFFQNPTTFNPLGSSWIDYGLGAAGRLNDAAAYGQFRVPTLRNIAKSAPYFHNGVYQTLEQAVHFYNARDIDHVQPEVAANVNQEELGNLGLTAKEEKQLVAFLKTLSDRN